MLLSDDEILGAVRNLYRNDESAAMGRIDDIQTARVIEAAILAKLASAELPEPYGWAKQSEIEQNARLGGSINLWRKKFDNDTTFYTTDQLRQAYAQGAAAQLSAEPVGEIMWDEEEQRRYVQYVLPLSLLPEGAQLYTRKEPK